MVAAGSWSCSRWTDRCKNDLDLNCDICRETDPEIGKAGQVIHQLEISSFDMIRLGDISGKQP